MCYISAMLPSLITATRFVRLKQCIPTLVRCSTNAKSYSTVLSSNVANELNQRGLIAATTSPAIYECVKSPTTVYSGFDPTAKSLHVGNLIALLGLLHFHVRGHQAIALIGGATGTIGDPSGRNTERSPLSEEALIQNISKLQEQIYRFFKLGELYAEKRVSLVRGVNTVRILNNAEWFQNMTMLEFMANIGRFSRVGVMLARESVKSRLENEQGISFTEFSYQLLQAYDFWHLYHQHSCHIQIGGSDQWGNITAGIDLIHKRPKYGQDTESKPFTAYGITMPLLITSSGEKFGKSAGNAVWLNDTMTSVFDFYQFFMKVTDTEVESYIPMLTLLPLSQIREILDAHRKNKEQRHAQRILADEVTELIHGTDGLKKAQLATHVLFGASLQNIHGQDIVSAFEHDQSRLVAVPKSQLVGEEIGKVAVLAGAVKSKSEAQKLITAKGFYLNNCRIEDPRYRLVEEDILDGIVCLVRTGKSTYKMIKVV